MAKYDMDPRELLQEKTKELNLYLQHPRNRKLLQILDKANQPIGFKKILEGYGSTPPAASISISIYEAERLQIVEHIDVQDTVNEKTKALYKLTNLGKRLLLNQ